MRAQDPPDRKELELEQSFRRSETIIAEQGSKREHTISTKPNPLVLGKQGKVEKGKGRIVLVRTESAPAPQIARGTGRSGMHAPSPHELSGTFRVAAGSFPAAASRVRAAAGRLP